MKCLLCTACRIRTTPGVASVEERQGATGRELTLTGLQPPGDDYYFIYHGAEGSHIQGAVYLETNWRGYVEFVDSDLRMNAKPPQEEIDATRPVMRQIEINVAGQCSVIKLTSPIHEECTGVECKPLRQ
jgi:hypothetical protein